MTASRGFTLTELMIAVALLVGVLLAVSKIFSTTSRVTGLGAATADVMQEAAAIERQIRADFGKLSYEGVFAIRCVAVPNDIHYNADRPILLNPNLDRDAIIRCDQLLFFTNGAQSVQTYQIGQYSNKKGQGTATRIYYGHAFQLGDLGEAFDDVNLTAHDPLDRVYPWTDSDFEGQVNMADTNFDPSGNLFNWSSAGTIELPPRDARTWLLARQPVALVDDDTFLPGNAGKTVYLNQVTAAYSIFLWEPLLGNNFQIFQGRVDAAATQLNDIRRTILNVDLSGDPVGNPNFGNPQPWMDPSVANDQRELIANQLLYYPRAERYPPSMHRVDQALSNHVLGSACSSIAIDWTWEDGRGEVRDAMGNIAQDPSDQPLFGVRLETELTGLPGSQTREQPWFGMPDPDLFLGSGEIAPDYNRGVGAYGDPDYRELDDGSGFFNYNWANTIPIIDPPNSEGHLNNIERVYSPLAGVVVYEAIFGYNQDQPLDETGFPNLDVGYTPWPSAVRVTLTLHDPDGRLENGREVQFVINLPPRAIDMPEP
ncbi:MAG: prepilin-type N-terminal cleavage/methylation domain-containing protein [Planctomycetota bacterium]|nr:prepilin-type N-terminal cleavage/methylation domain-containing protein [Planctomycetota bacterium]